MKALVTVDCKSAGDLLFFHGVPHGIKHMPVVLFSSCTIGNDTVVIQVTDDGQIQKFLSSSDIGNIRSLLPVRSVRMEIPVQQIRVSVQTFSVFLILFPSDYRQKIVFLHDTETNFGVLPDIFLLIQPYLYPSIAVCTVSFLLTGSDQLCLFNISVRVIMRFT